MASETYVPAWLTKRLLAMGFRMELSIRPVELPKGATAESILSPVLFQSTNEEPPSLELLFKGYEGPYGAKTHCVRIWLEELKPYFFSPRDEVSSKREDQSCDWLITGSVAWTDLDTPQIVPARIYLSTCYDGKLDVGYAQFQLKNGMCPPGAPTVGHYLIDSDEMIEESEGDPLGRFRRKPALTPNH